MGEAKRRVMRQEAERQDRSAWEASLNDNERVVLRVAERTAAILPFNGACYRTALFLRYHLHKAYGIESEAVVGFVNDGTDEAYSYHAWLQYETKIVDLALCRPLDPANQKAGRAIILDKVLKKGCAYGYHRQRSINGMLLMHNLLHDKAVGAKIMESEDLHMRMVATARSTELIRAYLDAAPDGLDYSSLARLVEAEAPEA